MLPLIELLADKGSQRTYRKGSLLIAEGEIGDEIFIIRKGQLRAFSRNAKGKEITHDVYGPNEYVGEMSLDGQPRSASVEAIETSVCAVISRQSLKEFIQQHPDFALEVIGQLIHRVRVATANTTALALTDAYSRLSDFLNRFVNSTDESATFKYSHQFIANQVGCSREMISRLMKDLEEGGYLITDGKAMRLLKPLPENW